MAARTSPFSTYKTYLYKGSTKLIDIKNFPDPLSPRELLDTTPITGDERTYRPGIREKSKLTFTCNYVKGDFTALKTIENTHSPATYSIRFGDNDGEDGTFTFNAYLSVNVSGKGVNEVQELVITLYPTSSVTFS